MNAESARADRPIVRVTTPDSPCYIIGSAYRTKIPVAIEITDVGGAGIATTDSGDPRFVDLDRNVETFLKHVVARGTYVNYLGQTVMPLFAMVPAEKLKLSDVGMSVPFEAGSVDFDALPKGAMLFATEYASVAELRFRVKDRKGVSSDEDAPQSLLRIGFAAALSQLTDVRVPLQGLDLGEERGTEASPAP